MDRPASFDKALLDAMPNIQRYCRKLAGADANDLLQETLSRALRLWASYTEGTNMPAWLSTIAFRQNLNVKRRSALKYEVQLLQNDGAGPIYVYPESAAVPGDQDSHLDLEQALDAMEVKLNPFQREAVTRAALGEEYDDIARAMACNVGTVKSRISRGRDILIEHFAC
jgi:RNA polymerase sigma-70 factor, ECF subfamily